MDWSDSVQKHVDIMYMCAHFYCLPSLTGGKGGEGKGEAWSSRPAIGASYHGTSHPAVLGHLSLDLASRCCWGCARRPPPSWGSPACPPCSPTSSVDASILTLGWNSCPLSMLSFGSVAWSLHHVISLLCLFSVWNDKLKSLKCWMSNELPWILCFVWNSCSKATRKSWIVHCVTIPKEIFFWQVFYASVELITDWTYVDMLHILLPDEISHYVAAGWFVYSLVYLIWSLCISSNSQFYVEMLHVLFCDCWMMGNAVSTYSAVSQHQLQYHRLVDEHCNIG